MTEIQKILYDAEQKAKQFAQAESDRVYLEEFKKSKLAILMKEFQQQGFGAISAQEREARSHDEYIELLKGLTEATKKSMQLKYELKVIEWKVMLHQTKQADRRAEMKLVNAQ
tara:strand:- start:2247 stop:2585 length:339 start_codon:yes stop_codon:yes gene_type:complete